MIDDKSLVQEVENAKKQDVFLNKSNQNTYIEVWRTKAPSIEGVKSRVSGLRFLTQMNAINKGYPYLGTGLMLAGGVCLYVSVQCQRWRRQAEKEIVYRKEQMSKPIYELKSEEVVDFPWDRHNLKEWLYRPIRITGRPMHYKTIFIPDRVHNYPGYAYIVPLVTRENEDSSEQWGILLNKGWIPREFKDPSNRMKIEDVSPQTFECVLTLNDELQNRGGFFGGNTFNGDRNKWTHLYIPDAAKFSGFKNVQNMKLALIEQVDLNTPLDENNATDRSINASYTDDYPYRKTRAGVLQLQRMPNDYSNLSSNFFMTGLLSLTFGLLTKVV